MGEDTAKLIPITAFLVLCKLEKYPKSTQDIKDSKAQEKKIANLVTDKYCGETPTF